MICFGSFDAVIIDLLGWIRWFDNDRIFFFLLIWFFPEFLIFFFWAKKKIDTSDVKFNGNAIMRNFIKLNYFLCFKVNKFSFKFSYWFNNLFNFYLIKQDSFYAYSIFIKLKICFFQYMRLLLYKLYSWYNKFCFIIVLKNVWDCFHFTLDC